MNSGSADEVVSKLNWRDVRATFSARDAVAYYARAATEVRLWEAERTLIQRYFPPEPSILDLGCGAGRTSFGLEDLGFKDVVAVDISEAMITGAKKGGEGRGSRVRFMVVNASQLPFRDGVFGSALFSFNGIEHIPTRAARASAMQEVRRVLVSRGRFIFTTHDRGRVISAIDHFWQDQAFWIEERRKWNAGLQDERLHEFGDVIYVDHDTDAKNIIFMHLMETDEVIDMIIEAGFTIIYEGWRSNLGKETDSVREFSLDCKMWVVESG